MLISADHPSGHPGAPSLQECSGANDVRWNPLCGLIAAACLAAQDQYYTQPKLCPHRLQGATAGPGADPMKDAPLAFITHCCICAQTVVLRWKAMRGN